MNCLRNNTTTSRYHLDGDDPTENLFRCAVQNTGFGDSSVHVRELALLSEPGCWRVRYLLRLSAIGACPMVERGLVGHRGLSSSREGTCASRLHGPGVTRSKQLDSSASHGGGSNSLLGCPVLRG